MKEKSSKKWIWILLLIVMFPIALMLLGALILLISFIVLFGENDIENELSEHGEGVIPAEYIPIYQEAGEEYDIDWILLAAIHRIETVFSTIDPMISHAGAEGHTQFMPCTWVGWSYSGCAGTNGNAFIPDNIKHDPSQIAKHKGYGVDGDGDGKADPFNIYDAIYSSANMLSSSMRGSTEDEKMRNAIRSYNHAEWYVNEVMMYYKMFSTMDLDTSFVEIQGEHAWVVPHTKNITSHFDPNRIHPIHGDVRPHNGIDISSEGVAGTPAVSFADGVVSYSQSSAGGWGNLVVVTHSNGISTYYAHLMYQGLPVGTEVKAGQTVGYIGTSGTSTGPHLHFELWVHGRPVDPLIYVKKFLE